MNLNDIAPGQRIKVKKLESTKGFIIHSDHIRCRQKGRTGQIKTWVPGHGGDVWFVAHDEDDTVGAYIFTEIEKV